MNPLLAISAPLLFVVYKRRPNFYRKVTDIFRTLRMFSLRFETGKDLTIVSCRGLLADSVPAEAIAATAMPFLMTFQISLSLANPNYRQHS